MEEGDAGGAKGSGDSATELARDLYLDFLTRELCGEHPDFGELCRCHPELVQELERLRAVPSGAECGLAQEELLEDRDRIDSPDSPDRIGLQEYLRRLAAPRTRSASYRLGDELGRGSMGRVFRAWDPELARTLAVKVLQLRARDPGSELPAGLVLRFLREAQITAQLDHPGIVPVHELGIDEDGRPFFAMKLVRGQSLERVFHDLWQGEAGWSLTRVVGVLLKVCEAVEYAHSKGIVHRDLKPSNIMVGRFGEVFVMDWGVAHVSTQDTRADPVEKTAWFRWPDAITLQGVGLTSVGSAVGTLAYMAPEQVEGDPRLLGAWTDVYGLGAILYQLLAQCPPYRREGPSESIEALRERIRSGPPEPLARAAQGAPAELVSICERAMARNPLQRYFDMGVLADDLRRYLEGRVVRAHRTGLRAELVKWVRRNRVVALLVPLACMLATVAGLAFWHWRGDRSELELLSRLREPGQLVARFDLLWPASRARIGELRAWVREAEAMREEAAGYMVQLRELRAQALPRDLSAPEEQRARARIEDRIQVGRKTIRYFEEQREILRRVGGKTFEELDLAAVERELVTFRTRVPELEEELRSLPRQAFAFATAEEDLLHDRLTIIAKDLDELGVGEAGSEFGAGMEPLPRYEVARRLLSALEGAERSESRSAGVSWEEALRCIGDPVLCPAYAGLQFDPPEHLVPLGPDPQSGLWEFAHALTGTIPSRDEQGNLVLEEASGLVLVLLPGGNSWRGSQDYDPGLPNFDQGHQSCEEPVLGIRLDPFLFAKLELTRAQWERLTGTDPAAEIGHAPCPTCPESGVAWEDAKTALACLGLALPSEAQWEYAARAGSGTPWWCGSDESALPAVANLCEPELRSSEDRGLRDPRPLLRDGWFGPAPVGSLLPNPFGLHDVYGNVAELTRDQGYDNYFYRNTMLGTGESNRHIDRLRIARGGSYCSATSDARSASRRFLNREQVAPDLGIRPCMDLLP